MKQSLKKRWAICCSPPSTFRATGCKSGNGPAKANLKFERRFREVERIVASRGPEMTGIDLDVMEEVWQEVKRRNLISNGILRSSAICMIFK